MDNKTAQECAEYFNCGKGTIIEHLRKLNIKKSCKQIQAIPHIAKYSGYDSQIIECYLDKNKTKKEIADILNIPVTAVDSRILRLHLKKTQLNITFDNLYHHYITLNKTQQECANYFSCHRNTIGRYLSKYNIKK